MWSELTYLIERRCREAGPPTEAGARALVVLYGALSHCEIAFERVESGGSDRDCSDAVLAMDAMLAVLHNVQPILELLDPESARELDEYLARDASGFARDPKSKLKHQVELLRRLLPLDTGENAGGMIVKTAFTGARRELARFIVERCPPEELFARRS
ncbi:MAG TPA: hypothetical protein VF329_05040 [Gammaproteobacteria bacterium]